MKTIISDKRVINKHLILIELIKLKRETKGDFVYLNDAIINKIATATDTKPDTIKDISRKFNRGALSDLVARLEKLQEQMNPITDEDAICIESAQQNGN